MSTASKVASKDQSAPPSRLGPRELRRRQPLPGHRRGRRASLVARGELRRTPWLVWVGLGLLLLTLAGAWAVTTRSAVSLDDLLRDPSATARLPWYTGAFSIVGVMVWTACAAICLFGYLATRGAAARGAQRRRGRFLLLAGGLTALLALDDALVLHEELVPRLLHLHPFVLFGIYAGAVLLLVVRFRRVLARSNWLLLGMALACFAVSLAADLLDPRLSHAIGGDRQTLLEDAAKLCGVVLWTGYLVQFALRAVRPKRRTAPRGEMTGRSGDMARDSRTRLATQVRLADALAAPAARRAAGAASTLRRAGGRLLRTPKAFWIPPVLMGALVLYAYTFTARRGISMRQITRDVASVAEAPFYSGYLSTVGGLVWMAGATGCLIAFASTRRSETLETHRRSRFLLWAGLGTLWLCFDDLFLFHEFIGPQTFMLTEKEIFGAYVLAAVVVGVRFRRVIARSNFLLVFLAAGAFAVSLFVDVFKPEMSSINPSKRAVLEDGPKLVGIALWAAYLVQFSLESIRAARDERATAPPAIGSG